eukprot:3102814-Rhodomonas_salina.2
MSGTDIAYGQTHPSTLSSRMKLAELCAAGLSSYATSVVLMRSIVLRDIWNPRMLCSSARSRTCVGYGPTRCPYRPTKCAVLAVCCYAIPSTGMDHRPTTVQCPALTYGMLLPASCDPSVPELKQQVLFPLCSDAMSGVDTSSYAMYIQN